MTTDSKSDTTIRPAVRADITAIGQLAALLVAEHHEFDPLRFLPATPQTPAGYGQWLSGRIGETGTVLLVAEVRGHLAGYVLGNLEGVDYMSLRGPAGILQDIVVDPAHRGTGVGRALLDAALTTLAELGAPRVVLSTAVRNERAQRLFTRAGFRATMLEMTRESDGRTG